MYRIDGQTVIFYSLSFLIVKYTHHKIYHFKVYSSVTLSTFIMLYNHHHLVPEIFHHPRMKPIRIKQ